MIRKIKNKIVRIKYYFKILVWAKEHSERVKDYWFLLELRDQCHKNFLQFEREEKPSLALKAKTQEELLNKILIEVNI